MFDLISTPSSIDSNTCQAQDCDPDNMTISVCGLCLSLWRLSFGNLGRHGGRLDDFISS